MNYHLLLLGVRTTPRTTTQEGIGINGSQGLVCIRVVLIYMATIKIKKNVDGRPPQNLPFGSKVRYAKYLEK